MADRTDCNVKPYLEYLDKEMTIMGLLSAISLFAPGGILSVVLAERTDARLWNSSHIFILEGSVLCVLAAFWFYKQRSILAWSYGQICLTEAIGKGEKAGAELREWVRKVDSWATWWPYSWGFTCLFIGFIEYLFAVIFLEAPPHWRFLNDHLYPAKVIALLVSLLGVPFATLQRHVLTRYKFSDGYWADFWSDLLKGRRNMPHHSVYTRLGPSRVHGVGVFAIADIPNGTYIFEPDDEDTVPVQAASTKQLSLALQELYKDFCVLTNGVYECPSSFNCLTPAWFLNHSKSPNVAADLSLKFYAIRDIAKDEELTTDYATYSDNPLDNSSSEMPPAQPQTS